MPSKSFGEFHGVESLRPPMASPPNRLRSSLLEFFTAGRGRYFGLLFGYPFVALFAAAQRLRCAAAILARASGLNVRFLVLAPSAFFAAFFTVRLDAVPGLARSERAC
jgi:hypothetical protein